METGRRIGVLDGWRGVSICLVLMGHYFPTSALNLGTWGVEWFFVLSGRLMAEILFLRRGDLLMFYGRRLARVYPALLVYVALTFVAFRFLRDSYKPSAAIAALTFTINYASIFVGHQAPIVAHVWSLCVEEHSYIILGLLALLSRRRILRPAVAMSLLAALSVSDAALSSLFAHKNFFDVAWRTDAHIYSILLGAVASLALQRPSWKPAWLAPVMILSASGAALLPLTSSHLLEDVVSTLCLCVAVNSIDFAWAPVRRLFNLALVRWLGLISFSLYLWQQPFYYPFRSMSTPWRSTLLILAFGAAMISFFFVETPSRRFLNRLLARRVGGPKTADGHPLSQVID